MGGRAQIEGETWKSIHVLGFQNSHPFVTPPPRPRLLACRCCSVASIAARVGVMHTLPEAAPDVIRMLRPLFT
jgi:hypothetical protein